MKPQVEGLTYDDVLQECIDHGLDGIFATASWPTYDGKTLHRASFLTSSEATSCDVRLYFDKVDEQEPGTPVIGLQQHVSATGIQLRGHVVEAALVDALRYSLPDDIELIYAGSEQRSFYSSSLLLSGTPDGALLVNDRVIPLEFKSHDPRSNINGPKPAHVIQLQQNAGLMDICINDNISSTGFVVYTDANDLKNRKIYPVDTSQPVLDSTLANNSKKAHRLFAAIDARDVGKLPATGVNTGECRWCPHVAKCPAKQSQAKPQQVTAGAQAFKSLMHSNTQIIPATQPLMDPPTATQQKFIGLARQQAKGLLMQQLLQSVQPVPTPVKVALPPVVLPEPSDVVDQYIAADDDEKAAAADKKDLKPELIALMDELEKDELVGSDGSTINRVEVSGRETFDYKGFFAEHEFPEETLAKFRKKGADSIRLDIKRKEN